VHGEGSSSPSADSRSRHRVRAERVPSTVEGAPSEDLTVVSIELKGATGEAVRIHLSDGSFFILHAEVFARAGISQGTVMDPEKTADLLSRSEQVFARVRALSLLSRAAHSRKGLARKLASRGFSAEAIRSALSRVSELGYLDDKAFAESWVRSRMGGGKTGWNALYKGLLGKGVARAVAEQVVSAFCSFEDEAESARQISQVLSPAAAIRTLTGRGFRSRTISRVLREKKNADRSAAEE
jgi:SOS response regulatory protein OraA/RecX